MRTYEELGETDRAVDIYQDIVLEHTTSQYARDANRRIFIVGGLSAANKKVRELAIKNSLMLKDATFRKLVEESERFTHGDNKDILIIPDTVKLPDENGEKAGRLAREKKINMMISRVEERISGGPVVVKPAVKPEEQMVKIYTTDGNIFTGTLVDDTGSSVVVRTSFGDIKIEKSRVSRRINL